MTIIDKRSSGANFIVEVLTIEPNLCNPESNRSKFINMLIKLCLESVCNIASIGSLVPETFDDHSLMILHLKCTLNRFYDSVQDSVFPVQTRIAIHTKSDRGVITAAPRVWFRWCIL
jgi:hypothetical protein